MGNVRNPVGPLPSSVYWRRRAVVLCLFALCTALVAWGVTHVVSAAGSGDPKADGGAGRPRLPLSSITPGPTVSDSDLITSEPGGRTSGGTGGGSPAAGAGGTDGGTGGPAVLPAGSTLPDCAATQVTLTIRSVQSSYRPGQRPKFALAAVNSGGAACKVNFSAVAAVVTVTDAAGRHVWASDDCPADRDPYLLQVPAEATTTYDVSWDRTASAPDCATPSAAGAGPGAYRVTVAVHGLGTAAARFTLAAS